MGACAETIVRPYGAMLAGFLTGVVSSLGYAYVQSFLKRKISLHDTSGVLSLFAMPGFIGGIVSAIVASKADTNFGSNYNNFFPSESIRTPSEQAGYQLAAIALSIGLGLFGGLVAGIITGTTSFFNPLPADKLFDDRQIWEKCEINHNDLHQKEVEKAQELSESKKSNLKHVITNVPKTVAEEQDLDNLNIERATEETQ